MNKFIILSNSRCGSTWLTTSLNGLKSVKTDYELKLPPLDYTKLPTHFILDKDFPNKFFKQNKNNSLKAHGTKLVFDPKPLDESHFDLLKSIITPDIKIIHLTRSTAEQIISHMNFGMKNSLKTVNIERNMLNSQLIADTVKNKTLVPRSWELNLNTMKFFAKNYNIRIGIDLFIRKLINELGCDFISVDYSNIADEFKNITKFVTSKNAPDVQIEKLSLTKKLHKNRTTNEKILIETFSELEKTKRRLLSKDISYDLIQAFF